MIPLEEQTKICSKCKEAKPLSSFYKKKGYALGVSCHCKLCAEEGVRQARNKRKEYYVKQKAEYQRTNKDRANQYKKNWIENNKEKQAQIKHEWYKRNWEYCYSLRSKRRALQLQTIPQWANEEKMRDIFRLAKKKSEEIGIPFHVDHIVPLKSKFVCGLHWEGNLQIITKAENLSKNNRWWPDMWDEVK